MKYQKRFSAHSQTLNRAKVHDHRGIVRLAAMSATWAATQLRACHRPATSLRDYLWAGIVFKPDWGLECSRDLAQRELAA